MWGSRFARVETAGVAVDKTGRRCQNAAFWSGAKLLVGAAMQGGNVPTGSGGALGSRPGGGAGLRVRHEGWGEPDPVEAGGLKLLVVVPALNEEATVGHVVSRVPKDIPGISQTEIIVVDDGSSDGTAHVAAEAGARVISHETPQGVGAVFHRALDLVVEEGADILVFIDGDGQFNAGDIRKIVEPVLSGRADCAVGSRYHPDSAPHRQSLGRRLGNRGMSRLVSLLTGRRIYDSACGFRAYSARTAMHLNLTGRFTYTQEALLDIAFKGGRIVEVPIRVRGTRKHGRSRVARSLVRYGVRAMLIIVRAYRDYRPLRFFGLAALAQLVLAVGLGGFFLTHFFKTGRFSPHLWAGMTAGFMAIMAALTCLTGILADMLDRIRLNEERLLFYEKLRRYEVRKADLQALPGGVQPGAGGSPGVREARVST